MRQSRLIGGVRRALVVGGAVLGVALLCVGGASADGPVELRSGSGYANGNGHHTFPADGQSGMWS